jgi:hypothetical protein
VLTKAIPAVPPKLFFLERQKIQRDYVARDIVNPVKNYYFVSPGHMFKCLRVRLLF